MSVKVIRLAILFGLTAIILGAFGAHALKAILSEQQLISFETGVRYQVYQALFLLFIGSTNLLSDKAKKISTIFITIGILFFSFSIYLLATQGLFGINFKFLGPITPVGGLLIMIGWAYTAIKVGKQKNNN